MNIRTLCVYCGSSPGQQSLYKEQAAAFGALLAQRGITLVYGGASIGLMGAVADAALAAGGQVIGVIPQALVDREVAHDGLSQLVVTRSMHERKARMAELSDGFVALPGGIGTLEEMFEIWTWSQLGMHTKPCGLLNVAAYYDTLIRFLDESRHQGFMRQACRDMLLTADNGPALLDALEAYVPPVVTQWVERADL